jgi:hypothetical protein
MRLRHALITVLLLPPVALTGGGAAAPAAVPVRYAEGTLHGFLELRNTADSVLAHGDLLQVPRDSDIETRLVFRFTDSSVFRETVRFTQHGVFSLVSYRLEQHGRAFEQDLSVELLGDGQYVVEAKSHKDDAADRWTGRLDLPEDVYNGMIIIVTKNLPPRTGRTVHVVAFTPKPLVLPLRITPVGTDSLSIGGRSESAVRFRLKPKLNVLQSIGAKLKGQSPRDSHLWIVTNEVPAFVGSEGPLYSGPIWRISLTSPRWPQ